MESKCKQDNTGAKCPGKSAVSTLRCGLVVVLICFEEGILRSAEGTEDMEGWLDELSSRQM